MMNAVVISIAAFFVLVAARSAQASADGSSRALQQTAAACNPNVITSAPGKKGSMRHTVDPWIVPSVNTTNGSLPPGVCPFSSVSMLCIT